MHDRDCCFGLPLELFETVSNKQTLQEEQPERSEVVLTLTRAAKIQRTSIPTRQPLVQKDVNF
jgi:hypothetical protein